MWGALFTFLKRQPDNVTLCLGPSHGSHGLRLRPKRLHRGPQATGPGPADPRRPLSAPLYVSVSLAQFNATSSKKPSLMPPQVDLLSSPASSFIFLNFLTAPVTTRNDLMCGLVYKAFVCSSTLERNVHEGSCHRVGAP